MHTHIHVQRELEALAQELAKEKRKEAELERSLTEERRKEAALEENLLKTKAALEEDERHLAEDKELFAKKDAEIEGLKKRSGERRVAAERLGNLQKEHEALKSDRDKTHKELEDAKVVCGAREREGGKLGVGYGDDGQERIMRYIGGRGMR